VLKKTGAELCHVRCKRRNKQAGVGAPAALAERRTGGLHPPLHPPVSQRRGGRSGQPEHARPLGHTLCGPAGSKTAGRGCGRRACRKSGSRAGVVEVRPALRKDAYQPHVSGRKALARECSSSFIARISSGSSGCCFCGCAVFCCLFASLSAFACHSACPGSLLGRMSIASAFRGGYRACG
jgi:hypothetical protein